MKKIIRVKPNIMNVLRNKPIQYYVNEITEVYRVYINRNIKIKYLQQDIVGNKTLMNFFTYVLYNICSFINMSKYQNIRIKKTELQKLSYDYYTSIHQSNVKRGQDTLPFYHLGGILALEKYIEWCVMNFSSIDSYIELTLDFKRMEIDDIGEDEMIEEVEKMFEKDKRTGLTEFL